MIPKEWTKSNEFMAFYNKMRIQRLCPVCKHNDNDDIREYPHCAIGKCDFRNTCDFWEYEDKIEKE